MFRLASESVGDEVFFDSLDDSFFLCEEDSGFWGNQLKSVQERRQLFFQKMGFLELGDHLDDSLVVMEGERIRESSEASSSSSSFSSSFSDVSSSSGSEQLLAPTATDYSMVDESEIRGYEKVSTNENEMVLHWGRTKMSTRKRVMNAFHSTLKTKDKGSPQQLQQKPCTAETKVQVKKKRVKELSALYIGQEFQAHKGAIWTAKSSLDGRYLATGGQDGVLRVWQITSTDPCEKTFSRRRWNSCCGSTSRNKGFRREKKVLHVPVIIPDKVFHIEETPLHEFHGHSGEILDLDWATSNCLLSSSVDSTIRLWQVGSSECLKVFHHSDFVTCVQFNPVDDAHFVSGSVDGKIRVWGVSQGRVEDWDDIRDSVTAISYQPDGQGFAVGSLHGVCRFYEASGGSIQPISQIQVGGCKRSFGNRITGIQFLPEDTQKVMVTSQDSKIRVLDKMMNITHKFRGLCGSGCQMSASLTHNQRHIVSLGEDSRVYIWDHDITTTATPTPESPSFGPARHSATTATKKVRSYESFHSKGVSVAVSWFSLEHYSNTRHSCPQIAKSHCMSPASPIDSSLLPLPCLSNLFPSKEGPVRVSATWPEELLSRDQSSSDRCCGNMDCSPAWGLVIVTGSLDGTIRAFHNYGLPVRV